MTSKRIALFMLLVIFAGSFMAATAHAKSVSTVAFGVGEVEIHNHTPYVIKITVDGEFEGYLDPNTHRTVLVGSGNTSLKARAYLVDGTVLRWDRIVYVPHHGGYTWTLVP